MPLLGIWRKTTKLPYHGISKRQLIYIGLSSTVSATRYWRLAEKMYLLHATGCVYFKRTSFTKQGCFMEKRCSKTPLVLSSTDHLLHHTVDDWTMPWTTSCPLQSPGSSAIHSVNQKKTPNFLVQARLWQGWRPGPASITGAGTGGPGLCWSGIPGHGQPGQGHECPWDCGTFSKTLHVTTRYKYGIENIIHCFYHIGSRMHPYLQDRKEHRGLQRILRWCCLVISLFLYQTIPS